MNPRTLITALILLFTVSACQKDEQTGPTTAAQQQTATGKRAVEYIISNTTGVYNYTYRDEFDDIQERTAMGDTYMTAEFDKDARLFLSCSSYIARVSIKVNGAVYMIDTIPPFQLMGIVP